MSSTAFVGSAVRLFNSERGVGGLCRQKGMKSFSHSSHAPRRRQRTPRAELESNDSNLEQVPLDSTQVPELEALDPSSGSVIVKPTFNLASVLLLTGGAMDYAGGGWIVLGLPLTLLGVLFAVQSFRIRFIFGPKRFSVASRTTKGLSIIRGWEYSRISNWEVWWKPVPILAYFKEKESYNGRGSVHFFPMFCDGAQMIKLFRERVPHLDKPEYS